MIWAHKTFAIGENYGAAQERFADLFMKLGGPRGMLMICSKARASHPADVYLALPDESLLPLFDGFSPAQGSALPNKAVGLVGHDDELARFR